MTDEQLLHAALNAPPLTGRTPESRAVSLLGLALPARQGDPPEESLAALKAIGPHGLVRLAHAQQVRRRGLNPAEPVAVLGDYIRTLAPNWEVPRLDSNTVARVLKATPLEVAQRALFGPGPTQAAALLSLLDLYPQTVAQEFRAAREAYLLTGTLPPQTDRVLGPRLLPPAIASLWARWDYQWGPGEGEVSGRNVVQRGIHRNAGMLLALWCA